MPRQCRPYLLVVGHVLAVVLQDALVGDEGEGEHADATVTSNQNLRNGAHA